jgi:hypothetical protein
MMQTAKPAGEQTALMPIAQAPITAGPEFDPLKFLDPAQVEGIKSFAAKVANDPLFDHEALMRLIQEFGAGEVPQMDSMLKSLKMQRYGEMAGTLQDTTQRMRRVSKEVPVIDPKWLKKVEGGKILFKDIADHVRWLADEINQAIDLWSSFLNEFEEADQELRKHQELMRENRLRNDAIAKQEFVRATKLMQLCATLILLRRELANRLNEIEQQLSKGPNQVLQDEKQRLENLTPIIINTLGSLVPLIPTTSNNGIMFTQQRNDNALQEFRLFLFRELGIAQWKANTIVQLNAASNQAASLALSIAQKAMNEQGVRASDAYKQQMTQVAQQLQNFMMELDTFQQQVSAIEEAGQILTEGLKAADQKALDVSRQIDSGRRTVEKSQANWSQTLRSVLSQ